MGKKKSSVQKSSLGRTLIKERFGGHHRNREFSEEGRHTTELEDGYDWGRLNLRSVTEQSALDEFLSTAALAGTEFTAEKLNIKVVQPGSHGILTEEEEQAVRDAQEDNKSFLSIPRRPNWDELTTPEELESMEKESFLKWRRTLALLQENDPKLMLTPYEKNLDIWRQLWRVVERSDVICQIVDGRNPLLFKCDDLETYVKEMDTTKKNLILINKADFLTEQQRTYWAEYFKETDVIFWSALNEKEKQEKETKENKMYDMQKIRMNLDDDFNDNTTSKSSHFEVLSDNHDINPNDTDNVNVVPISNIDNNLLALESLEKNKQTELLDEKNPINNTSPDSKQLQGTAKEVSFSISEDHCNIVNRSEDLDKNIKTRIRNSSKMLSGSELLDLFRSFGKENKDGGSQTVTIGLVGYPNVGKSSTINALLHDKKTAVSATPGKTKHFQTLLIDEKLCLCDCPGLVFPTFVSTKADMVVNGILPIDEMRNCIPPVNLLCKLIPRHVLEHVYGINIPFPGEGEDPNRPPTADEFLQVYACMRGFMSSHGAADCSRASRYVLKDFIRGKLLYCHPPPNVDVDDFLPCHMATELPQHDQQEKKYQKSKHKKVFNEIDKQFFHESKATPYVKVPSGMNTAGSIHQEGVGKPWKKHYNRNKREKLRRLDKL